MATGLNRAYHGLQVANWAEKNQTGLDSKRGVVWRDPSLTTVAIAEAAHVLSPVDRAELLKKLEEQNKFLRKIEVD